MTLSTRPKISTVKPDDLSGGLVDERQRAAIATQVVEAEDALGLDNSRVETLLRSAV
jgi:hypothetical protein